jgi:hypothetical protein
MHSHKICRLNGCSDCCHCGEQCECEAYGKSPSWTTVGDLVQLLQNYDQNQRIVINKTPGQNWGYTEDYVFNFGPHGFVPVKINGNETMPFEINKTLKGTSN